MLLPFFVVALLLAFYNQLLLAKGMAYSTDFVENDSSLKEDPFKIFIGSIKPDSLLFEKASKQENENHSKHFFSTAKAIFAVSQHLDEWLAWEEHLKAFFWKHEVRPSVRKFFIKHIALLYKKTRSNENYLQQFFQYAASVDGKLSVDTFVDFEGAKNLHLLVDHGYKFSTDEAFEEKCQFHRKAYSAKLKEENECVEKELLQKSHQILEDAPCQESAQINFPSSLYPLNVTLQGQCFEEDLEADNVNELPVREASTPIGQEQLPAEELTVQPCVYNSNLEANQQTTRCILLPAHFAFYRKPVKKQQQLKYFPLKLVACISLAIALLAVCLLLVVVASGGTAL